ncbi:hypothetical protein DIPPA_33796 [Diplonema papillatum]|nr:hypothetical protein DIPPA_33796 [Diplonema papillatum]
MGSCGSKDKPFKQRTMGDGDRLPETPGDDAWLLMLEAARSERAAEDSELAESLRRIAESERREAVDRRAAEAAARDRAEWEETLRLVEEAQAAENLRLVSRLDPPSPGHREEARGTYGRQTDSYSTWTREAAERERREAADLRAAQELAEEDRREAAEQAARREAADSKTAREMAERERSEEEERSLNATLQLLAEEWDAEEQTRRAEEAAVRAEEEAQRAAEAERLKAAEEEAAAQAQREADAQRECVICFDVMVPDASTFLPCAHGFHTSCIREWLTREDVTEFWCPTCHQPVPQEFRENV